MAALDFEKIDLFRWADQLPTVLWDDLCARSPREAAEAAGAEYTVGTYRIRLLARDYEVDPATAAIRQIGRPVHRVSYNTGVVLLTTLAKSQGPPPSGNMVTPSELPGGRLFFAGPHELPLAPLIKRFGDRPQDLLERATLLGGRQVEASADMAVMIPGLPKVPLWVLLWAGDEEFKPRAVIGIDDRAHFHLAVDATLAISYLMVQRLIKD